MYNYNTVNITCVYAIISNKIYVCDKFWLKVQKIFNEKINSKFMYI
jgi:hypothetical protein